MRMEPAGQVCKHPSGESLTLERLRRNMTPDPTPFAGDELDLALDSFPRPFESFVDAQFSTRTRRNRTRWLSAFHHQNGANLSWKNMSLCTEVRRYKSGIRGSLHMTSKAKRRGKAHKLHQDTSTPAFPTPKVHKRNIRRSSPSQSARDAAQPRCQATTTGLPSIAVALHWPILRLMHWRTPEACDLLTPLRSLYLHPPSKRRTAAQANHQPSGAFPIYLRSPRGPSRPQNFD